MMEQRAQRTRRWPHWRWLAPAACGVLLGSLMGTGMLRSPKPQTVSQVRQEILKVVLHKQGDSWMDHGGPIGPWHVAASSLDGATGELRDFRLVSGSISLAAARATLIIDHKDNTFSFQLSDVVIMNVPTERDVPAAENHLIPLDSFMLGPARYHRKIVPG